MKKLIIAASLVLGICSFSFAQTVVAKTSTDRHPSKMAIAQKQQTGLVSPTAKSTTGIAGKTAGDQAGIKHPASGTAKKTTMEKKENKAIGKKNKAEKKALKANKKAAKPMKTSE